MEEIIFVVRKSDDGGYIATTLGASIVTEADMTEELKDAVKDPVHCHYDDDTDRPKLF